MVRAVRVCLIYRIYFSRQAQESTKMFAGGCDNWVTLWVDKFWLSVGKICLKSSACEKNHKFELARFLRGG
jgi:hypothetical protein